MYGRRTGWRGMSRRLRALTVLGTVLAVLAGAGMITVNLLTQRYASGVSRADLIDGGARDQDRIQTRWTKLSGPLTFLLIGSDARVRNPDAGQRSDTIVIVQTDAELRHAYLVSIPRDLLVQIPATDGFGGAQTKINAAFEYGGGGAGGVRLLSATLNALTGVQFNGAAVIDFGGFRSVIDILGGVKMCVDTEVTSIHTGRVFTPGCHQMDGATALDYSRQRYGLEDGDYDRQRHQQQLLRAILTRARQAGVVFNPFQLDRLIRAVGDSLTVDTGDLALLDLLFSLRDLRPENVTGIRLPSYPTVLDSTSYVLLTGEAGGLFEALRNGDVGTWAAAHPDWVNPL